MYIASMHSVPDAMDRVQISDRIFLAWRALFIVHFFPYKGIHGEITRVNAN